MITSFLGSRVQAWLSWVCCSRVSLKAAIKVKARAGVSSEARLGKDLWLGGFNSSLAVRLRISATCLLLAEGCLQFLATGDSPYTNLIHQIQQGRESVETVTS